MLVNLSWPLSSQWSLFMMKKSFSSLIGISFEFLLTESKMGLRPVKCSFNPWCIYRWSSGWGYTIHLQHTSVISSLIWWVLQWPEARHRQLLGSCQCPFSQQSRASSVDLVSLPDHLTDKMWWGISWPVAHCRKRTSFSTKMLLLLF